MNQTADLIEQEKILIEPNTNQKNPTIFLIDDSPINLMVFQQLANSIPNVDAVAFSDPIAALSACQERMPDLLVLDYMMPKLDGLTFLRQLRAIPTQVDIPVLVVTSSTDKTVRYAALQLGAVDFLNKPIDSVEFQARIQNMLALRSAQLKLAYQNANLREMIALATADLRERERETLLILGRAAEYRDVETGQHIIRMSLYARLIAQQLGLNEDEIEKITLAAPMHDLGKIGIPDNILLKTGSLTEDEFQVMRRHPYYGYKILSATQSPILKMGALIALSHHEKFDGSGYPSGLKEAEIPLCGRIVAVADVFDALTSKRPYKKAWPIEQAYSYLTEQKGKHLDPECVEALLARHDSVLDVMKQFPNEE